MERNQLATLLFIVKNRGTNNNVCISESQQGSSRHTCWQNDLDRATAVISEVEQESNHKSSIRDCFRLGKYTSNKPRPRPLLVSLNSTADVSNILSRRHFVPSSIVIKPDLSQEERKVEAILVQERWKLIQSGIDRQAIKIRKASILVNVWLHGRINNSVFTPAHSFGKLASKVSTLSVSPPANSPPTNLSESKPYTTHLH